MSRQRDLALVPDAPLRILRRFRPTHDWTLETGDLLYLPPRCAHDGVAVGGDCITYSIGFRAPDAQELGTRFLDYLQERIRLEGLYEDPWLKPASRPARLDEPMVRTARRLLQPIRWSGRDVADFLGRYLTEPKAHVVFARPGRPLSAPAFGRALARAGARLAPASRMLFRGNAIYLNGEALPARGRAARVLSRLADRRSLPPATRVDRESAAALYQWYRAGYLVMADA